jgi:hypothetical protein
MPVTRRGQGSKEILQSSQRTEVFVDAKDKVAVVVQLLRGGVKVPDKHEAIGCALGQHSSSQETLRQKRTNLIQSSAREARHEAPASASVRTHALSSLATVGSAHSR